MVFRFPRTQRFSRVLIATQLGVVSLVFGATQLLPMNGEAGVLVPFAGQSMGQSVNWVRQNEARVLGAGPIAGTIIVRSETSNLNMAALSSGMVLIATDAPGCSPSAG